MSIAKSEEMLRKMSTMSLRLDPKRRYLAGLAAREQETTLTHFLEQAVCAALETEDSPHLRNEGFWDADPAIRLYLLASGRPDLLSDVDRRIWRRIVKMPELRRENGSIDRAKLSDNWVRLIRMEE